mmetsp:Transcript_34801/g.42556  ORF Transcript_34801/g.42556 Transcript_34801/m.42556 type:complete len:94 (-) Transcript_34801:226-507(-)
MNRGQSRTSGSLCWERQHEMRGYDTAERTTGKGNEFHFLNRMDLKFRDEETRTTNMVRNRGTRGTETRSRRRYVTDLCYESRFSMVPQRQGEE